MLLDRYQELTVDLRNPLLCRLDPLHTTDQVARLFGSNTLGLHQPLVRLFNLALLDLKRVLLIENFQVLVLKLSGLFFENFLLTKQYILLIT